MEEVAPPKTSDIVVIGASVGGVSALPALLSQLPSTIAASFFVVLHMSDSYGGDFAWMLSRRGALPAHFATDGETIRRGVIYVAPPRRNMVVERGRVAVQDSPRESFHRPSINALFRSAAIAYGQRVVAVILTGTLEDGAAGAWEVWRRGGTVIVQDPADAFSPELPRNVLNTVRVDYCAPLPRIAELITQFSTASRQALPNEAQVARLIIVEDERLVAVSLENALGALGYEICATTVTGEAAVDAATRIRPDLVLMDIRLGGAMDGTHAADLIWKRLHIPVIYLTAYADEKTLAEVKRTEAYGYVMKPYEAKEVHAAIQIALERREREQIRMG